jgi:protoporphyrinogen/coproporphyrinogen III oxidase
MTKRVVIVGAGITGLTAAYTIKTQQPDFEVTVVEASERTGGNIRTSPFAGLDAVDEGPDAFLVRIPYATQLVNDLGFTAADLTAPATGSAYVWHNKLHSIPAGLMLGVPGEVAPIAKSGLLSPIGKIRAAIEPLLPRTNSNDSIGRLIRKRFGNEVHEFLVDPLIGSIYASDTDNISINSVPQLATLAEGTRSLLFAVRKQRKSAPPATTGSVFTTPLRGIGSIIDALMVRNAALGVTMLTKSPVLRIEPGYNVQCDGRTIEADIVVVASPAAVSAPMFRDLNSGVSDALAQWDHVGVTIATLRVDANQFPANLNGSGYLVPKRDQNKVTAVSFASNKWAHWRPSDGSKIMRVSLGQDGNPADGLTDDEIVSHVLTDLNRHLGVAFEPTEIRISRWANAFPQYRPGHFNRVEKIENELRAKNPGVFLAGASHRGIGIPACVQQARAVAEKVIAIGAL